MDLSEAEKFLNSLEGIFNRNEIDLVLNSLTEKELKSMSYNRLIDKLYYKSIKKVLKKDIPTNITMMFVAIGMLIIFIILIIKGNIFI